MPDDVVTVGCLFAAMGGFAQAFEQEGAAVLWANEKDKFARETFVANFPHVTHHLKPVEDLSVVGDALQRVDVLTAGFPCQPFSAAECSCTFPSDTSYSTGPQVISCE